MMTFEVGAVLEDTNWQGPEYCFVNKTGIDSTLHKPEIASMRPDGIPRANMRLSI